MELTREDPGGEEGPLGFGDLFTGHMVTASWQGGSWSAPALVRHGQFAVSPALLALHYGQAIFEGLKAYRASDGSVSIFRPTVNAQRFARSAERMAMPPLPEDSFVGACELLVDADRDRVPAGWGKSLYLRPLMFASEAALGLRPAGEYTFLAIASPVDPLLGDATAAMDVWCSTDHIRAARGGTGEAKCAGNYAASLAAKRRAMALGCGEVLWLDAAERTWIEELGVMNFFAVLRSAAGEIELVTPPLDGTILRGVTRDSLIELAPELGYRVRERRVALAEFLDPNPNGPVAEAFGCGTAAVVWPIAAVLHGDRRHPVGDGKAGQVTLRLREELLNIQHGRTPDSRGWMRPVPQLDAHGGGQT